VPFTFWILPDGIKRAYITNEYRGRYERKGQIGKHIDEWDNGLYASGIINEVAINFLICS
jgi:hypothetical protein